MPRFAALPDPGSLYPVIREDGTEVTDTVFLRNAIDHPGISVGNWSFATDPHPPEASGWQRRLMPYHRAEGQDLLSIGRFCQIAEGVRFIGSASNLSRDGITTFPFALFDEDRRRSFQPDVRDIEVGSDVWFAQGARVLPGARVGDGVIIGAGSVVRGKVPDYAVVAGNPARVLRMRYPPLDIARLMELAWWNWPGDHIAQAMPYLEADDIGMLERIAP